MKEIVAAIAVLAVITFVGFGTWSLHNSQKNYVGRVESITIGIPPLESSALIYIADDQGYFARNGLDITVKDYEPAIAGVDGMLNGSVDLAGASEYAVVLKAFKGENISIIVSGDEVQSNYFVCRKDRGIENISDLKGKTIGLPRGTICEFFLGRFLNLHGMSLQDVTLVDVPAAKSVDAIANGDVDAIIYFQPHVYEITNRLGDNCVIWPAQSNQLLYGVMACKNDWAANHPELINRFLKSLAMAEEYAVNHPNEAKAIVQKRLNVSDAYIISVWPEHQFSLSLDQSLLIAMNDEGRWAVNNNLTSGRTIPDFRDYSHSPNFLPYKLLYPRLRVSIFIGIKYL